jgi:hypothetical protein
LKNYKDITGNGAVKVNNFINEKSQQLCYYLRGYWGSLIAYTELELFFWDVLEEWSQVDYDLGQPYSNQERVFWHLLHQIHSWDAQTLMYDDNAITGLQQCIRYLEGTGRCPIDCVGIRP